MRVPRDLNIQRKSIKFIPSLSNILLSCSVFLVSPLSILDIKGDSNFRPESECQYEVSEDKKREKSFFPLTIHFHTVEKRYAITSKDLELSKLLLSSVVSSLFPLPQTTQKNTQRAQRNKTIEKNLITAEGSGLNSTKKYFFGLGKHINLFVGISHHKKALKIYTRGWLNIKGSTQI